MPLRPILTISETTCFKITEQDVRISTKLFRKIGPRPDDRDQWSWTFFWDHRYFEILNWTVQMISMYKSATASDWLYLYTVIYLLHIVPVWLYQTEDHGRSLLDSWIPIYIYKVRNHVPRVGASVPRALFRDSLPFPCHFRPKSSITVLIWRMIFRYARIMSSINTIRIFCIIFSKTLNPFIPREVNFNQGWKAWAKKVCPLGGRVYCTSCVHVVSLITARITSRDRTRSWGVTMIKSIFYNVKYLLLFLWNSTPGVFLSFTQYTQNIFILTHSIFRVYFSFRKRIQLVPFWCHSSSKE